MKLSYIPLVPLSIGLNLMIIRRNINHVDDQIYDLLYKRKELATFAMHYKTTIYDERREKEIIERLKKKNLLPEEFVDAIWQPIFNYSKSIQSKYTNMTDCEG